MDLKTGVLYWPSVTPAVDFSRLESEETCDVVIVGAGLTGATITYELSRNGFDVVVLDKRDVGTGSTSASTALVLYEIDTPLYRLIQMRGMHNAVESYRSCREAIASLHELVREIHSPCQFRFRPSLYLASNVSHVARTRKEFETRRKHGFDVEYFTRADVEERFSFNAPGAIFSADGAELNPLRLTFDLLRAAKKRGARIYANTTAEHSHYGARRVKVRASTGHSITARWLVVASGYETNGSTIRRLLKLQSTYVLVTKPVTDFAGWHQRCLIWETADPYFYLRTTADNRIVIGGADAPFKNTKQRDGLLPQKTRQLLGKLKQMFPEMGIEPDFQWAGTFGKTTDGLPCIGRITPRSRALYALCYGANGTNFAILARDAILHLIQGGRNTHKINFGLASSRLY
jgi:glycine/D-amino acid oxidase-like deaminating enzyme